MTRAKGKRLDKEELLLKQVVGLTVNYNQLSEQDCSRNLDITTYGLPEGFHVNFIGESWKIVRCPSCGDIGLRIVVENVGSSFHAETIHGIRIIGVDPPDEDGQRKCDWDGCVCHVEQKERAG
jgi:hypothetical protein